MQCMNLILNIVNFFKSKWRISCLSIPLGSIVMKSLLFESLAMKRLLPETPRVEGSVLISNKFKIFSSDGRSGVGACSVQCMDNAAKE